MQLGRMSTTSKNGSKSTRSTEVWSDGPHGRAGLRITIICEGETERAFMPHVRTFLKPRLPGKMPRLSARPCAGRVPTGTKLQKMVEMELNDRPSPADAVIALTDVYTGTNAFT